MLYSGEDDELLRRAAAGGLAMLTSMRPSLCSRIPQVVSCLFLWGAWRGVRELAIPHMVASLFCGGAPRVHMCFLPESSLLLGLHTHHSLQTTHWLEILQALLLSPNPELQHRGTVVVLNMMESSKEIASTLMESEVLEILSVLAKGEESPVTRAAAACLEKAVEYRLIQPNQDGE